jgi:hypothetical protein
MVVSRAETHGGSCQGGGAQRELPRWRRTPGVAKVEAHDGRATGGETKAGVGGSRAGRRDSPTRDGVERLASRSRAGGGLAGRHYASMAAAKDREMRGSRALASMAAAGQGRGGVGPVAMRRRGTGSSGSHRAGHCGGARAHAREEKGAMGRKIRNRNMSNLFS